MKTTIVRGKHCKCWGLQFSPKSDKILIPIKYKIVQDCGSEAITTRLDSYYHDENILGIEGEFYSDDIMITIENKKYKGPILIESLIDNEFLGHLPKEIAIEEFKNIASNCERVHIIVNKDGVVENIIYTLLGFYIGLFDNRYSLSIKRITISVFDDSYPSMDFLRVE